MDSQSMPILYNILTRDQQIIEKDSIIFQHIYTDSTLNLMTHYSTWPCVNNLGQCIKNIEKVTSIKNIEKVTSMKNIEKVTSMKNIEKVTSMKNIGITRENTTHH